MYMFIMALVGSQIDQSWQRAINGSFYLALFQPFEVRTYNSLTNKSALLNTSTTIRFLVDWSACLSPFPTLTPIPPFLLASALIPPPLRGLFSPAVFNWSSRGQAAVPLSTSSWADILPTGWPSWCTYCCLLWVLSLSQILFTMLLDVFQDVYSMVCI